MNETSIVICKILRNTALTLKKSSRMCDIFSSFVKKTQYIAQPFSIVPVQLIYCADLLIVSHTINFIVQTEILCKNIEHLGPAKDLETYI